MNFIEKPIYLLLQEEPFFANFLLGSKITLNHPKVPTAGARVEKGQVHFVFNTEFMLSKTILEQVAIIKHEIFHVLLDHCGVRGNLDGQTTNREAKNIAMDCAINQYIKNLPEGAIILDTMEKIVNHSLEPYETWEYYYQQIKKAADKSPNVKKGAPNHEFMEGNCQDENNGKELSETEKAINRVSVKDLTNKSLKAAAGKIPDGLVNVLAAMNKPAQLPWKQILRNFISSARCFQTKNTKMRVHRRFELEQPGKKKLKKLILGVCTDSSGSVSNESYEKFMHEIASIAKNTTITYLVHADCEVQKVDKITGGKAKGDVLKKRHGSGGTAYQPAIDECLRLKCDAIIYFGDMDAADTPNNPGKPFLWVRVGNSEPPGKFGKVLDII